VEERRTHLQSNCGALLKRNSSRITFLVDSQEEEMRRILHFWRIKGVLRLRRTRGKRGRFSCWEMIKLF